MDELDEDQPGMRIEYAEFNASTMCPYCEAHLLPNTSIHNCSCNDYHQVDRVWFGDENEGEHRTIVTDIATKKRLIVITDEQGDAYMIPLDRWLRDRY
jgi:hypothetical protein